ncbi:hypothetical protein BDN72DRAFT_353823 [Pluteus cervinus]|uniref:Uncharacterized protein n=1 Tax=Pluteus cervinus TaxID=181527 RepID=A0ACD3BE31_9AGAR|nr:hypothetical protein BDN72DRAFT_353823 [Pluteus cervinus]
MTQVSSGSLDPITLRFITNSRPIASFFLGAVFIVAAKYSSLWLHGVLWRCGGRIRRSTRQSHAEDGLSEKGPSLDSTSTRQLARSENLTLVFTLSLCFIFASIARFASLLTFHPGGAAGCAFVVAWGGMAAQTARLIGLVILFIELRYLGIGKWESVAFLLWMIIGVVFLFVNNAIATGSLRSLSITGMAVCERKHVLSTSLASLLLYLVLELYVVGRLFSLFAPEFLNMRHRLQAFNDLRIWKALSLLLLELLSITPLAMPYNLLGDIIPFSIGAILVLVAFNHRHTDPLEILIDSIPQSIASPSRAGSATPGGARSLVLSPTTTRRSVRSSASIPVGNINAHPFSAKSSNNQRVGQGDWTEQLRIHTARSSRSLDTDSIQSAQRAIVQMAQRRKRPQQAHGLLLSPIRGLPQAAPSAVPEGTGTAGPGLVVLPRDGTTPKPITRPPGLPSRPRIVVNTNFGPDSPQKLEAALVTPPLSALFGQDTIRPPDPVRLRFSAPSTRPVSWQTISYTTPNTETVTSPSNSLRLSRWPTFNEDFPPNAITRTQSSRRSSMSSLSTVLRGHLQNFPPFPLSPPLPRQSVVVGAPRGPRPLPTMSQGGS